MKRGCPKHPKVSHLRELLKISLPAAIGNLELLWHFTAEFAPQGDVGRYSDARIEAALSWSGKKGRLVQCLTDAGWLDRHPERRLIVHDWADHADSAVRKRLERSGLNFYGVTAKVTEQRPPAADNGSLARAPSNPIRSHPSPEPEPEPDPIDTPPLRQTAAKTAETLSDVPLSDVDLDELRSTLALWTLAFPEGPHEIDLENIRRELSGTPPKVFCAHLDQLKKKFQPGGSEEPTRPGFFTSTARNFSKEYRHQPGNGLSPAKFDAMSEVLELPRRASQ